MYKTTVSTLLLFFFLWNSSIVNAQNSYHSNHLLIKFEPDATIHDIQSLMNLYHADLLWISDPSQMMLWVVNFSIFNPFSNIHEVVQSAQGKPKVKSVGLDIILDLDYIMNNPDYQMQSPEPILSCDPTVYDIRPKSLPFSSQPDGAQVQIGFIDSGGPFYGIESANLLHSNYFDQLVNLSDVGYDIYNWDNIPDDENGHGIHTGGIVALEKELGPSVNMGLKFFRAFDQEGSGTLGDVIRSIDIAVEQGMSILSLSIGYQNPTGAVITNNPPLREVIDVARTHNVLVIAAAGNDQQDNDNKERATYPASFELDNIISVAASDCERQLADFSNFGQSTVDLAAPGVEILSTYKDSTWAIKSGTSQAVPFVTYVAGLLASIEAFDYQKIKCAILNGVQYEPGLSSRLKTGGILDGPGAISAFLSGCGSNYESDERRFYHEANRSVMGIFPNPTSGDFQLSIDIEKSGPVHLQIMSTTGQLIQEQQRHLDSGLQTINLYLASNLPQGVYLLKIHEATGSVVRKIIKQ